MIIFPLNLQTSTITRMLSSGGERVVGPTEVGALKITIVSIETDTNFKLK